MSTADRPAEGQERTDGSKPATDEAIVQRPFGVPNPTTYTTKGGKPIAADADEERAGSDRDARGVD